MVNILIGRERHVLKEGDLIYFDPPTKDCIYIHEVGEDGGGPYFKWSFYKESQKIETESYVSKYRVPRHGLIKNYKFNKNILVKPIVYEGEEYV